MCAQILWYVPQDFPSWPGGGHGWWLGGFAGQAQTRSLQGLQSEPGRARHRAAWWRTFRSKAIMHGEDPALSGNLLAGKRFGTCRSRARSELVAVMRAIGQANR